MKNEEYFKVEMPGVEMFAFLKCIEQAVTNPKTAVTIVKGDITFEPDAMDGDDKFTFNVPLVFVGKVVDTLSKCADEPTIAQTCITSDITLVTGKKK